MKFIILIKRILIVGAQCYHTDASKDVAIRQITSHEPASFIPIIFTNVFLQLKQNRMFSEDKFYFVNLLSYSITINGISLFALDRKSPFN